MHVRIAWEIYHHQQKGGSDSKPGSSTGSSSTGNSASKPASLSSSAAAGVATSGISIAATGLATQPVSTMSVAPSTSLAADLLRSTSHGFPGLGRGGDAAPPPPFASPLLSPHAPHPHASPRAAPYDSLFLNSAASHLGKYVTD